MGGLAIIGVVVLASLLAPVIAPQDPFEMNIRDVLKGPSKQFWLGTDEFGRDILSRLLWGLRPSLIVALSSTAIALVVGTILGLIAGYMKGKVEQLIMRAADTLLCFPPILLALVIVGFLGPGMSNLILVIGFLYIPTFTRLTYGSTITIAELDYINAAYVLGASRIRILWKHILPNIVAPVIVQSTLTMAAAILLESGLSFLSLGVPPPTPSLGHMIGVARGYLYQSPLYVLWPSLVMSLTVLALNVAGDALRDLFDPRLRG